VADGRGERLGAREDRTTVTTVGSISVVIPCFDKGPWIGDTIRSALAQTRPVDEVIVIDDGSTDDSAAIAESFGPPVKVVRQANQGESVARNRGIELASGDWIAFLDADDVWAPERLERQVEVLQGDGQNDVNCVYTDVWLFESDERTGEFRRPEYHSMPDWRVRMLCDWSINPSTTLVRAKALEHVCFPVDVQHSEDMIFFIELRERGRFLRIPELLVGYRRNAGNQSGGLRHRLESVRSRWDWFRRNEDRFSPTEVESVRASLAAQLSWPHDTALWQTRDTGLVAECRRMMQRIHPDARYWPATFRRRVYPRWAYELSDLLRGRRHMNR
jgi:glycosyltransferase involved in cell wall biosynthesis